ncbi:hypothetical protein WMY93_032788 [Mugilogobius chulae]|uniref:Uncharacterized protein n=1 Tax=Mugilogobius chulae TaxID=88201 RepID=A0AAW0MVC4_9GOBI
MADGNGTAGQMLRVLVNERLTAAAEEIFALFERTIAEFEAEMCRSKEENQRKQELLDSLLSTNPEPGLNQGPDHSLNQGLDLNHSLTQGLDLNQDTPQIAWIKEEQSVKRRNSSQCCTPPLPQLSPEERAAGPDFISTRLLWSCADELSGVMEHVFSLSPKLRVVPQLWKTFCVVPFLWGISSGAVIATVQRSGVHLQVFLLGLVRTTVAGGYYPNLHVLVGGEMVVPGGNPPRHDLQTPHRKAQAVPETNREAVDRPY